MITPESNIIKEKPEEIELFPHSDSAIWKAFKKKSNIENSNNPEVLNEKNNLVLNHNEKQRDNLSALNNKSERSKKVENKNNTKKEKVVKDEEVKQKADYEKKDNTINSENLKADVNSEKVENIDIDSETKLKVKPEKKENKNNIIIKDFFIQLASVSDENLVIVEWKRLLAIYPELATKKYDYKKVNLKNGETYYRILLGKFKTKKESEEFCQNILKKNKCLIRSYE